MKISFVALSIFLTSLGLSSIVCAQAPTLMSFNGKHGLFSVESSWAVDSTTHLDVLRGRVEFLPSETLRCSKIQAVQVAKVLGNDAQDFTWSGGNEPRNQMRTAADQRKGIQPGYFVDHDPSLCQKGSPCSTAFRDHWPNADESSDGFRDGASFRSASLIDYPYGWELMQSIQLEACMKCQDSGEYLGCVKWGARWPAVGARELNPSGFSENPSPSFFEALRIFSVYYHIKQ